MRLIRKIIVIGINLCFLFSAQAKEGMLINKGDSSVLQFHLRSIDYFVSINLDSAFYHANKYEEFALEVGDAEKLARAKRKKGIILYNKAQYVDAITQFNEALSLYEEMGDHSGMAATYNNFGVLYRFLADYDQSLRYFILALKEYERIGLSRMIAATNFNIGSIYEEIQDHEQALKHFEKSYTSADKLNDTDLMGTVQMHAANIFTQTGRVEKAIKAYHAAKENFETKKQIKSIAKVLAQIAKYHLFLQNYDSALLYVNQAIRIDEASNPDQLMESYKVKADLFNHLNQYDSAIILGLTSLRLAEELKAKKEESEVLHILSKSYKQLGQLKKALGFNTRYTDLKDSIYSQDSNKKIREIEIRYQTENKQKEIELLTLKSSFQEKIILFGITCAALIVLLLLLMYNRIRLKNTLLEQQKTIEVERNVRMKEELDAKNRELTTHAVHLIEKNEMLDNVKSKLLNTSASIIQSNNELKDALKLVNSNLNLSKDWQQLKLHFENVHPHFFDRTQTLGNKLSQNELKHCAYIKMKLSVKEVARMLNVEEKSVRMSHYRIKKKLSVTDPTSLSDFIASI